MTAVPYDFDPFDDAMTDEPQRFAGQVRVDAWKCVLKKGQGKVPFDPVAHKGERTSVAIDVTVEPLDPTRKLIERSMLNWTSDFKQVMRPSVERLAEKIAAIKGLEVGEFNALREINELWVIGQFTERPDNKPGETWTTVEFLDVFGTMAECEAAYLDESEPESDAAAAEDLSQWAAFLPPLWESAGHDKAKFETLLASNPMLAERFSMTSAEVVNVVGA